MVGHFRQELESIVSQNNTLRHELTQTRTGIAGAIETLNMLQLLRRDNEVNDIYDGQITTVNNPAAANGA